MTHTDPGDAFIAADDAYEGSWGQDGDGDDEQAVPWDEARDDPWEMDIVEEDDEEGE